LNNLSCESFSETYRLLPCERLSDHPLRLDFYSQAYLKELEASILCNGLLEPLPQGKEQERVYSIVKKNSLSKDETSKLVDKWLLADEAEQKKLEVEFTSKTKSTKDTAFSMPDPGKTLGVGFRQCTKLLDRLNSYLECLTPPYTYWPWEDYLDFMAAVEKMSKAYTGSLEHKLKGEVVANAWSLQ
jgi:hypothetical protein